MPTNTVSAETRQRSEALTRLFNTLRAEAEQLRRCVSNTNNNNNNTNSNEVEGNDKEGGMPFTNTTTIAGRTVWPTNSESHVPSAAQQALALHTTRYNNTNNSSSRNVSQSGSRHKLPNTNTVSRTSGRGGVRSSHRLGRPVKSHSTRSIASNIISSGTSASNTMSGHESRKVALIAGRPLVLSPHSVRLPSVFTEQRQAMRAVEEKLVYVRDTLQRLGYNAGGRAHELQLPPVTAIAVEEAHRQFIEQLELAHGPTHGLTLPGRPTYAAPPAGMMNSKWGSNSNSGRMRSAEAKSRAAQSVRRPRHTTYLAELEEAEDWATLVRRARVVAADEGNTETQSVADYADEPELPSPTKYNYNNKENVEGEGEENSEGEKRVSMSVEGNARTDTTTVNGSSNAVTGEGDEAQQRRTTTTTTTTNVNNNTSSTGNTKDPAMTAAARRMRYEVYAIRDAVDKIITCATAMLTIESTHPSTAPPEQAWWSSALSLRDMKANAIRLNYHARAALRWSRRVREHLLLQAFAINHHAARSREELVRLQSHLREFTERTEQSVAAMNAVLAECDELQDALHVLQARRVELQEEILQAGLAKGEFNWLHGNREEQEVLTAELAMLLRHGVRWPRSLHGAVQQVLNWIATEPVCLE